MVNSNTFKILYLVHDLSDSSVHRRIAMLQAGGAHITVAGFRRYTLTTTQMASCDIIDFGQTYNARFMHRIIAVISKLLFLRSYAALFTEADIIIARNLEMLALAVRGKSMVRSPAPLVYESLDIHRLMLGKNIFSTGLRWLEGRLARHACALITSSPAFVAHYFKSLSQVKLPVTLMENKVYPAPASQPVHYPPRPAGPPWKIGWFGAIRCRKSLQWLTTLVQQSGGKVEVIIRGKPALDQFDDFHKQVSETPGLQFLGSYQNPQDLESIYREVHFTWAIDKFEEGLNSSWLLPNRLYEGGLYASVPIAEASVETGTFLSRIHNGVLLSELSDRSLNDFFSQLTAQSYQTLEQAANNIPASNWVYSTQDCEAFVNYLRSLKQASKAAV